MRALLLLLVAVLLMVPANASVIPTLDGGQPGGGEAGSAAIMAVAFGIVAWRIVKARRSD